MNTNYRLRSSIYGLIKNPYEMLEKIITTNNNLQLNYNVDFLSLIEQIKEKFIGINASTDIQKWYDAKVIDLSLSKLEPGSPLYKTVENLKFCLSGDSSPLKNQASAQFLQSVVSHPPKIPLIAIDSWKIWSNKSLGNQIGGLLRKLSVCDYPLNAETHEIIDDIMARLISLNPNERYAPYAEVLNNHFILLKSIRSRPEALNIISNLLTASPLRTLIIEELKESLNPLMRYLSGQNPLSSKQTISALQEFKDVLRRWKFIENDGKFDGQGDPSECLQFLFNFLQAFKDEHSYPNVVNLIRHADPDHDENYWTIENVGRGKASELEKLTSVESALERVSESTQLPLILPVYPYGKSLFYENKLNYTLLELFKVNFEGYRIKDDMLQRVSIPLGTADLDYNKPFPSSLFFQPACYNKENQLEIQNILIPPSIEFEGHTYILSKCVVKNGNQNGGHYTFWTLAENNQSLFADSLTSDPLILSNLTLAENISYNKTNKLLTLLEYQLQEVDPKTYAIKQKIYQDQKNSCYIVQVLYLLYGNHYFSTINQVSPSLTSLPQDIVWEESLAADLNHVLPTESPLTDYETSVNIPPSSSFFSQKILLDEQSLRESNLSDRSKAKPGSTNDSFSLIESENFSSFFSTELGHTFSELDDLIPLLDNGEIKTNPEETQPEKNGSLESSHKRSSKGKEPLAKRLNQKPDNS